MNKNQFPIGITQAKKIAILRLGKLPKVGYSVVIGGVFTGNPPSRTWDYQLSLYNYAGKFFLQAWERPFITPDMSKFTTIEYERDNRS